VAIFASMLHTGTWGSGSGLVAGPVFKTAMETPSAAPVGSIPTRSRHPGSQGGAGLGIAFDCFVGARAAHVKILLALALALAGVSAPLLAQDTTAVPRADTARTAKPDSAVHPPAAAHDSGRTTVPDSLGILRVNPTSVLWRSLLVPGWGQLKMGQPLTAGLFIAAEAVTLGMTLKANSDLNHLRSIGADSVTINNKSQSREDWIVFMVVNHLAAGLEAFVSANLSDFPADLKIRRVPGGMSAQVAIPVHIP
jgi:hypothetical protein